MTRLYALIRDLTKSHGRSAASLDSTSTTTHQLILPMDLIRDRAHQAGFSDEQLQRCLIDFDEANVWNVTEDGTALKIIN